MKTGKFFYGALAIAMLAACSSDENGTTGSGGTSYSRATFSASIKGQTRAYDTSWEAGDEIGISGTSGDKTYSNVAYTTANGDGNFSVVTSGKEIYFQDDNAVTFTAYYPWTATLTDGTTIAADTREQANQKEFDFLWSQASGSKASPKVAFAFYHKMTKVALTVKKGDDVTFDEVKDVILTLDGFNLTGTFDVTTGETAADAGTSAALTFANNTDNTTCDAPSTEDETAETVTYSMIVFPQEFSATLPITAELTGLQTFKAELDFTTANTNAGDASPKNEWVAGRQYNISVTLYKTYIVVEGCTIVAWDSVDGGNFDAE